MRNVILMIMMVIGIMGCDGCNEVGGGRYYYLEQPMVDAETKVMGVYIDVLFNDRERGTIEEGISRWNKVLNGYKRMDIVGDFSGEIEKMKEADRGGAYLILSIAPNSTLIKNDGHSLTLGFTDAIGGKYLYLVPEYIGEEDLYGIVLHEIGHLMGARHTEGGLMKAGYSSGQEVCIDKGTVEQIREYDWKRMNYCIRD